MVLNPINSIDNDPRRPSPTKPHRHSKTNFVSGAKWRPLKPCSKELPLPSLPLAIPEAGQDILENASETLFVVGKRMLINVDEKKSIIKNIYF